MTPEVRIQGYNIETIDRWGNRIGVLNGVTGGNIAYSAQASVKSSGTIEVADLGDVTNWTQTRLKVYTTVDGVRHALGVFLPSVPEENWSSAGRFWSIEVSDKTSILQESALTTSYSVPRGTNVVNAVKALIELSGEPAGAITPTDQVTRGDMVWEPGTYLLEVINTLLDSSNFLSLWCNGDGQFQVTPYTAPAYRAVRYRFEEGERESYLPEFSKTEDIYSVPNRFIGVTQSSEDEPALSAFAIIEDDNNPYSFNKLGRWKDEVELGLEAPTQAALYEYCERRLESLVGSTSTVVIRHLYYPFTFNNAVWFKSEQAGVDNLHVVTRMEVPLSILEPVVTTLRQVVEL